MDGTTAVKVELKHRGVRHTALAIYLSCSYGLDLETFISDLTMYCNDRPKGQTHLIVGDLNCCILLTNTDPLSQCYLDVLIGAGSQC